ncbi:MAG: DUF3788 domain-containing protein [Erysipelotrichaceae bacterium]|nr:DUF3788 domain-containing protein [Erysipelotrichaceae bacterium]
MNNCIMDQAEIKELLGETLYEVWKELCTRIEAKYDMDKQWGRGGKKWRYEYKYRRGGKTLCSLCINPDCLGLLIVLGKKERDAFEAEQFAYTAETRACYEQTETYHDGKWLMLLPHDSSQYADIDKLLRIKRRPNRK